MNIVGILKIKGQIYGSNRGKYQYLFQPFDHKIPPYLVYTNINRTQTNGDIIAIIRPIGLNNGKNLGQIVQKIGSSLELFDLLKGWIYYFNLEHHLKKHPISNNITDILSINTLLYNPVIVTNQVYSIDPIGCTDIDDAFDFVSLDNGYQLSIHIACMGHLFNSIYMSLIDRSWSLYLPNSTIYHLLPETLVKMTSLLAGQSRLAISLILKIDNNGNIVDSFFQLSQIKSSYQYDYQRVDQLITSGSPYWKQLSNVIQLIRNQKSELFIDNKVDSHIIIETMMILYNYLGCNYLINNGYQPILRQHKSPESTSSNIDNNIDKAQITLPELSQFLQFLDYQSANYTYQPCYHFGLGIKNYGHLTSPIRRLVDAYNQLLLLQLLKATNVKCDQLDLDLINQIEIKQRKFYRKCQLYQLYLKYGNQIQKEIIYPYMNWKNNCNINYVYCYWSKHQMIIKIKQSYQQQLPKLYQPYYVNLSIIMTGESLPKIRVVDINL